MKRKFAYIRILSLIMLLSVNGFCNAQSVIPTEIPVSYDVTSTGAFTYSLPLEMPPGIKNLLPNLSITYSSQGANSNLGMGWSLTGVSSITRAGTTIFHDQALDPVNFNQSDVFMLDGQRLVETSPTTFMTEIKNYAIIQSHGAAGNGPSYFTVEYPNGLTYEYGNSDSSKMVANGRSDVLVWAVNKIYDKNGNFIEFNYHNDKSSGSYRICDIFYAGNSHAASVTPNHIKINYTSRPDWNLTYVGAIASATPHVTDKYLVSSIEIIFSDSSAANTYEFTYDLQSDYSRLTEIKEKRGINNYLPSIKVGWGTSGTDTTALSHTTKSSNLYYYSTGDFNGDGGTDFARVDQLGSNNNMEVWFSDKKYDFLAKANANLTFASSQARVFNLGSAQQGGRVSLDYNGDGFDDIILIRSELPHAYEGHLQLHYYQSNGNGFDYKGIIFQYDNNSWCGTGCIYTSDKYLQWTRVIPGDFDGDGKKDLLVIIPSDLTGTNILHPHSGNEGQKFDVFIVGETYPNGGYTPNLGSWGSINSGDYRYVGKIEHELYGTVPLEYDGDGKTELLTVGNSDHSHDAEIWQLSPTYTIDSVISPGNLAVIYDDTFPSHRSRIELPTGVPHGEEYKTNIWTGDFNGDGKDDILTYKSVGGQNSLDNHWELAYSTGVTSTTGGGWQFINGVQVMPQMELAYNGPWLTNRFGYQVADFNGDGKADILEMYDTHSGVLPSDNSYTIFYSKGYGFSRDTGRLPDSFNVCEYNQVLGDFNGDGQLDVMCDIPQLASPMVAYFRKNDLRNTVSSIEHAGKRLDIETKTISAATPDTSDEDHYGYNDWHIDDSVTIHTPREYPYASRQLPLKVVTTLKDNISLYRSYYYQTLSFHLLGLGIQGFEKVRVRDYSTMKTTINHFSLFHWWGFKGGYTRMPYLFETLVTPLNSPNDLISRTHYNYFNVDGDPSGRVRIVVCHNTIEANYAVGSYTDNYSFYDFGSWHAYDFGQPEFSFVDKGVENSYVRDSTVFTYDVNATFCNKVKPVSVRKTSTYPTRPSYSRTTNYGYHSTGLVAKQVVDPGTANESTTDYFYDPIFGNLDSTVLHATGLPNVKKSYDYTKDGKYQIESHSYLGNIIYTDSFAYSKWGKMVTHIEPTGLKTTYTYDSVNRMTITARPDDVREITTYDWAYNDPYGDNPNPVFSNYTNITQNQNAAQFMSFTGIDGWSYWEVQYFDFYGRKIRHAYPSYWGAHTIYEDTKFYPDGKVMEADLPYYKGTPITKSTEYWYDDYDREIKRRHNPGGPLFTSAYNASVLPAYLQTTVTNTGASQTKTTFSSAKGAYYIDDNGTAIATIYNSNGAPDEVTVNNDPNLTTSYSYDAYGRLATKTEPNKGTMQYTYNAYDQVVTEEDAKHTKYTYRYDALGRIVSKVDQHSKGFYYTFYDMPYQPETGKIHTKTTDYDSTGKIVTTEYKYNSVGKVEKMIETVDATHSYTTKYFYGAMGKLSSIIYPSGIDAHYVFTFFGQLWQVYLDGQLVYNCDEKDELNGLTKAQLFDNAGNPLYLIDRTYNPLGMPDERKVSLAGSNFPLSWEKYVFDNNTSNLTHREDLIHNLQEDFTYDGFDRLTDVNSNTSVPHLHLNYDPVGNILSKNDLTTRNIDWQYTKYALKTVPDEIAGAGGIPLASVRQPFDQNINYYPFNKVKQITEGPNSIRYMYNADQERVMAVFDPAMPTTKEKYYATNYEEIHHNGDTIKVTYIGADGEPIAAVINKNGVSNLYYIVTDYLGSITMLLDQYGIVNHGVAEQRSFDAWGRPRDPATWQYFPPSQAPAWMIDKGYTGQEHIWMTGHYDHSLVNLNGRLYDPLVGRMLSPDPVNGDNTNSQAFNKYSYVLNNPLKYTDPTGHVPFLVFAVIFGACYNAAAHGAEIEHRPQALFPYLIIGAVSTYLSAQVGALARTAVSGMGLFAFKAADVVAGSFTGAFTTGAGNTIISGGSMGQAMYVGAVGGAQQTVISGLMAGFTAGINAMSSDRKLDKQGDFFLADREEEPRQTGQAVDPNDWGIYVDHMNKKFQSQLTKGLPNTTLGTEAQNPKLLPKDGKTTWGITEPTHGNWFFPDRSNIVINVKALSSDVLLLSVLYHEYSHAVQIATGVAAILSYMYIGNEDALTAAVENDVYFRTSLYIERHVWDNLHWIPAYKALGAVKLTFSPR